MEGTKFSGLPPAEWGVSAQRGPGKAGRLERDAPSPGFCESGSAGAAWGGTSLSLSVPSPG